MESKTAHAEPLAGKLQRIEDLAEKLIYIKWSREFFVLLQRAAQDTLNLTRGQPEYQKIAALAEQIDGQISECLEKGELPKGTDRDRLIAVTGALCRSWPAPQNSAQDQNTATADPNLPLFLNWQSDEWPQQAGATTPLSAATVWLVASEPMSDLVGQLENQSGFQVQQYPDLAQIGKLLAESQQPAALIIDLDHCTHNPAILQQITTLRQTLAAEAPILFIAERGDITARLEAVEMGGSGYFTKPIDTAALVEVLERWISCKSGRVLIIDDTLPTAREIARWLENRGLITQVLAQPLQALQAIRGFQPGVLIMNLDIKETNGLQLAQVLQQHEQFQPIPLILLSAQTDIRQRLTMAGLSGEMLLDKPPDAESLLAAATKRLRHRPNPYRSLNRISNRDSVSGLCNRPYFLAHLHRTLTATTANAQPLAVMLISLDNLRPVEVADAAAADEIIRFAAKRLQAALGTGPITARFGDAVFTVLLGFTNQEGLLVTGHAVRNALETDPYPFGGSEFRLRASIGISIASPAKPEAALLIQQADLACGMARGSKDTRIHVHHAQTTEQDTQNPQQHKLLEEIREAAQQQRMNLLFQPIVSLRGDPTERYEVLLRMRNKDGWELLPETVFSLVKRHRIGMVLDRWVIVHAIRSLRQRLGRGHSAILFINISPTILQDEELFNWLRDGLKKTEVPASSLVFEIAETTAEVNKQTLQPLLLRLKELGCGLSLDHFSGRERGLTLAQLLEVNYVKLESRYTADLVNDKARQQELTQLARRLASQGITPILTGIENGATLPVLWSCGIDYVQGFVLQRPHTDMSFDFGHVVL